MQAVMHASNSHHAPGSPHSSSTSSHDRRHTFTHLTYSRHHLIDIGKETISISENGQYTNLRGEVVHIKKDLDWAVENCVHYNHEFDFDDALKQFDIDNSTAVVQENAAGKMGGQQQQQQQKPPFGGAATRPQKSQAPQGACRFQRTSFLVVSASWLEAASELLNAEEIVTPSNSSSSLLSLSPKITNTKNINGNTKNGNHNQKLKIRVGVLNSASSTTPGGRFLKGTVSQEDCLCRASLLYSCISQPKFQIADRFYRKNRSLRYGSSNCVIFSPDVPVIREDTVEGKLLDRYQKVSFVTIPAPNAFTTSTTDGKEYNDIESEDRTKALGMSRNDSALDLRSSLNLKDMAGDLKDVLSGDEEDDETAEHAFQKKYKLLRSSVKDRIHRALSAFVLGDCTDLVLPAFGCGVHGNDPSMVASVFREMLTDPEQFGGRFRTVVFAIPPSRKQNYQAFSDYFNLCTRQSNALQKPSLMRRETVQ